MFKIYGEYKGKLELLEECESLTMANYLLDDFKMTFGNRWAIWMRYGI